MNKQKSITILHLSDTQFGRNHRFGRLGLPPPDDQFDSLFVRLRDDLDLLKRDYSLQPDLLIATGDLAEWGRPSEFADVHELLIKLSEHLKLPRHRVIIVPGNHDISRKACEAYFNQCEAEERTPTPPFRPKWNNFGSSSVSVEAGYVGGSLRKSSVLLHRKLMIFSCDINHQLHA